jgi:hypothetical protein
MEKHFSLSFPMLALYSLDVAQHAKADFVLICGNSAMLA